MNCPHCEQELTPEEVKTLWANYTTSLRQTLGGPKRLKRPCPSCGMMCTSAREAWSHCRIPRRLDPEALLLYVLTRMPGNLGVLGGRYETLEALQAAVNDVLARQPLKPKEKQQIKWYLSLIEKALDKLENAA